MVWFDSSQSVRVKALVSILMTVYISAIFLFTPSRDNIPEHEALVFRVIVFVNILVFTLMLSLVAYQYCNQHIEVEHKLYQYNRQLKALAETDTLTKLANRRFAETELKDLEHICAKHGYCMSIAIGDIDFFKHVNDTYGHDAGDDVLVRVADTIREHMKNCGFVARWGGEEFLMVFDRTSLIMAENSLWGLLDKIRAMEIRYDNYIIKVTMSFGVSEWDKEGSVDSLIKSADDKLYYAKNNGRNRVVSTLDSEGEAEDSEITEIDKLLQTISEGAKEHHAGPDEDGESHFENLSHHHDDRGS
jgi:diguanylate cyclase (GGDEF)-like protein